MSDCTDFEDIYSDGSSSFSRSDLIAFQRLMDRLKAIEAKVDSVVCDSEIVRTKNELTNQFLATCIRRDTEQVIFPSGHTPPLARADLRDLSTPQSSCGETFRGHPVRTPEEMGDINLPPEPEDK